MAQQFTSIGEKRTYWEAQVGRIVIVRNYRGDTAEGLLLKVCDGVWGYGGDAVALQLTECNSHGLAFWPAGLAEVSPRLSPAH
jgi:hypothetical protein